MEKDKSGRERELFGSSSYDILRNLKTMPMSLCRARVSWMCQRLTPPWPHISTFRWSSVQRKQCNRWGQFCTFPSQLW